PFLIALVGLALMLLFMARRITGAILLGIIVTTAFAIVIHYITGNAASATPGTAVLPDKWVDTPDFSTFGKGINFDSFAKLGLVTAVLTIFSFMLSDFF